MSAYDQNSSDFIYCFETKNEKFVCHPLNLKISVVLTQTDQRLSINLGTATEENLDFVNCRYNENYEKVKKTTNESQ